MVVGLFDLELKESGNKLSSLSGIAAFCFLDRRF